MRRLSVVAALAFLACAVPATLDAAPPIHRRAIPLRIAAPARRTLLDVARRVDAGRINMFTTNTGSFAWDLGTSAPGLIWPRGTGQTAVFASGLWLGGVVNGEIRTVVAEYTQEYGPGPMQGATFVDPNLPQHKVYKVARWRGDPSDTAHVDRTPAELAADPHLDPLAHHAWSEYIAGAKPYGAPTRIWRLPDTSTPAPDDSVSVEGPQVLGDIMTWEVHNDADPSRHSNDAGNSTPLGVEIQQTTFAYDRTDDLGNVLYMRFVIRNRGVNTLDSLYVGLWSDPDLGSPTDDLTGCDVPRALGYAYNGTGNDAIYGSPPPAVGYVLLRGPVNPSGYLGLRSFTSYINGTDPASRFDTYNYMQGLLPDGSAIIDPTTGQPTRYFHSGDPVSGTGWIDTNPADRRMLLSSGPVRMIPGETQETWAAIVVGRGTDHLSSVGAVRCLADIARDVYVHGFPAAPTVPAGPCSTAVVVTNCPEPAAFWALECQPGPGLLDDSQIDQVAAYVSDRSALFDWPIDPRGSFCATVDGPYPGDLRSQARSEFAAFLANMSGSQIALPIGSEFSIRLNPGTTIHCPPLRATSLGELAEMASTTIGFQGASYFNDNTSHRRAIEGVNAGLSGFGGGAGPMDEFFGSSISPSTMPDSFVTVEIRFDHTTTQRAYRYLRLEDQIGAPPIGGRTYRYAGFHAVPFTCWDIVHNVQLDVGFVERAVTDAQGSLLGPTFQPATHDSTWGPNDDAVGSREYLIVFSRPYSSTPKSELEVTGLPASGFAPALYALWSRLRTAGDVIDDGDRFQFQWGLGPSRGADSLLVDLESRSLADPAVQQAYQQVIDCLSAINQGIGIGQTCRFDPTPTLVSLVSAEFVDGRVRVAWFTDQRNLVATLERREARGDWAALARVSPGADGTIAWDDADVVAGGGYDYRLVIDTGSGAEYLGEVHVDVPSHDVLAFLGPRSGSDGVALAISLATREPARLEIMDIAGRRIVTRDLSELGPGVHTVSLGAVRMPSGIYLVRLTQGAARVRGKMAIVH